MLSPMFEESEASASSGSELLVQHPPALTSYFTPVQVHLSSVALIPSSPATLKKAPRYGDSQTSKEKHHNQYKREQSVPGLFFLGSWLLWTFCSRNRWESILRFRHRSVSQRARLVGHAPASWPSACAP
jgi:hypothetical protein